MFFYISIYLRRISYLIIQDKCTLYTYVAKTSKYSGFCNCVQHWLQNAECLSISLSGILPLTAFKFWRKCFPAYACRCSQKTKHIDFLESLSHCVALTIRSFCCLELSIHKSVLWSIQKTKQTVFIQQPIYTHYCGWSWLVFFCLFVSFCLFFVVVAVVFFLQDTSICQT